MTALEKLFGSAFLHIGVPTTAISNPPEDTTAVDDWLDTLAEDSNERSTAFYDERLESLLLLRIHCPGNDPKNPPNDLIALLAHIQISLEASYIPSSVSPPSTVPGPQASPLVSAPPRAQSLLVPGSARPSRPPSATLLGAHHPSIFPPATPNPTPFATEQDRKYLNVEGVPLSATFWGQDDVNRAREAFWLLWSPKEGNWIAVYRLVMTVSFLRLQFVEPLLCLTVSTTLRERPLNITRYPNHPIASLLSLRSFHEKDYSEKDEEAITSSLAGPEININDRPAPLGRSQHRDGLDGLEEVNLLDGLSASPSFREENVELRSTRLGSITRSKQFLLPFLEPQTPTYPSPGPTTAARTTAKTMKKSYRKTLPTVSGFRVRMRTVFVPAFLFPKEGSKSSSTAEYDDDALDAAASDERTVVLCVEIENSGEAGPDTAFQIEKIDVQVQSSSSKAKEKLGGAKTSIEAEARLVGWGDDPDSLNGTNTFPLSIGAHEQYNLLYVVTFLRNPAEDVGTMFGASGQPDMLRAVGIEIFCRPRHPVKVDNEVSLSYPTPTYSSKWNCTLDLSSASQQSQPATMDFPMSHKQVLPEPASPFPGVGVTSPRSSIPTSALSAVNLSSPIPQRSDSLPPVPPPEKRHTMPPVAARAMGLKSAPLRPMSTLQQHRLSEPVQQQSTQRSSVILPPSLSAALSAPRSPTTYGAPSLAPPFMPPRSMPNSPPQINTGPFESEPSSPLPPMPMTPAYPSYPPSSDFSMSPSHLSAGPTIGGSLSAFHVFGPGSSTEIRREKGTGLTETFGYTGSGKVPQTPAPIVATQGDAWGSQPTFDLGEEAVSKRASYLPDGILREPLNSDNQIVVSVGLVAAPSKMLLTGGEGEDVAKPPRLKPFDHFALDIFVYNQSSRTRRFEVGCPLGERKRKGANQRKRVDVADDHDQYGVIPLDNRVRVGPLHPGTCQSIRMKFLALSPGLHAIDSLTITDIESRSLVNLRSVMDIVIH